MHPFIIKVGSFIYTDCLIASHTLCVMLFQPLNSFMMFTVGKILKAALAVNVETFQMLSASPDTNFFKLSSP